MARVLLCGEVRGRISELHRLLEALQKKGPFDFVLCVGNFFASCKGDSFSCACSNTLPGGGLEEGNPKEDLAADVREALAQQFSGMYEELQRCCSSLPLPIYIVDEAASLCFRQVQRRRHSRHPTQNDSRNADTPSVKVEGSSVSSEPPTGPVCPSPDTVLARRDSKPPTDELDPKQPEADSQSASCVPSASHCTSTALQFLENVWLLPGAGMVHLHDLNVAFYALAGAPEQQYCNGEGPIKQQKQQEGENGKETLFERLAAGWGGFKAFRGRTDILLTTRPPNGIFDGLPVEITPELTQQQRQQQQPKVEINDDNIAGRVPPDTKDDAQDDESGVRFCSASSYLADFLEPRHLICTGLGRFWQRPHFRGRHFGYSVRLISLGIVGEKGPQLKAFHALQLRPITSMLELLQQSDAGAQQQQQTAEREEAAQEARAALFFLPSDSSSPNPFVCASRDGRLQLPPSPIPDEEDRMGPPSLGSGSRMQGPLRAPKRQRKTGVVLVDNLPYEVTDGEALQEAMKQFGEVKFVFIPKDKADPTRSMGTAYVVYVEPSNAEKAVQASGQLEGGGRPLRMRLHYDKIPFDRPTGAKRMKCGEVVNTEPHADCWFCLANPQVEKHMIVDIGDLLYSAIPKGGLVPQHLLLIPIAHLPSLAYADASTCREASLTLEKIRKAFRKEDRDLVVYERYVPMKATRAMHSQIHLIPCKRHEALRAAEFFEKRARRAGLNMQKLHATADLNALREKASDPRLGYFYVEIPGVCTAQGQTIERYLHVQLTGDSGRIPMNFGREVMAELIGEKDKVNWQACVVPRDEEERLAGTLRKLIGSC